MKDKVMKDTRPYCLNCARHVGFRVLVKNGGLDAPSGGKYLVFDELVAVCCKCGEEVYSPLINDINVESREAALFDWRDSNGA